jgi:4-amino-4-deoxy-L-arabinose transferase-like glycosyltransferase
MCLIGVLLLSFGVRLFRIQHHNIWGDEAFSIAFSKQALNLVLSSGAETHPPLYHALLHVWISLVGESVFSLRYFSVLPGVTLIAIVFVLGRRLFGSQMGLLTAAMMGISSFAVYYSQEARMYSWVACFCTIALYAHLRWELTDNGRWLFIFVAGILAAVFTHYYSFFVLLAQNLYMFQQRKNSLQQWRKWIWVQIFIFLIYIPWASVQLEFITSKASARWQEISIIGMNTVWVGTLTAFGVGETVATYGQWLGVVLLIPLATGIRSSNSGPNQLIAVLYWLIVPLVGALLVAPLMPFYFPRYLIVGLPAYLLLVVLGFRSSIRSMGVAWLILFVAANISSLNNYFFNQQYAKGGYGDLMAYIEDNGTDTDGILLQNGAQAPLYAYYGNQEMESYNMPPWDDTEMQPLLELISSQHQRIWLVMYGDAAGYDPDHMLEGWLHQRAFRSYHGDYIDGSLDLFVQGEIVPSSVPEVRFGDMIALIGFGYAEGVHAPGGTLPVTLAWRTLRPMERDYTVFMHLVDRDGKLWAQADSQPLGGTRPTSRWQPGETVIDRVALPLAAEMPPGEYRLQAGWYELASMQRLPASGASSLADKAQLGAVEITFQ